MIQKSLDFVVVEDQNGKIGGSKMDYPVIDMKATGARIVQLRKQNHLRVEDISRFMGFETGQAVYKWQRGESLPSVDNLFALSKLFGTSVDDILCGKEEDEKSSSFSYAPLGCYVVIWCCWNKRESCHILEKIETTVGSDPNVVNLPST